MELPRAMFKDVDAAKLTLDMVFEYMIGNTDFSIVRLHNVRLVQDQTRTLYPVPYDFDFSGLVDTRYSAPDKRLGIPTVRDRLYRGPCLTQAELEPVVERFRARKSEILALYDSIPDLAASNRKSARGYLEEFFSNVERADRMKRTLIDGCTKSQGM